MKTQLALGPSEPSTRIVPYRRSGRRAHALAGILAALAGCGSPQSATSNEPLDFSPAPTSPDARPEQPADSQPEREQGPAPAASAHTSRCPEGRSWDGTACACAVESCFDFRDAVMIGTTGFDTSFARNDAALARSLCLNTLVPLASTAEGDQINFRVMDAAAAAGLWTIPAPSAFFKRLDFDPKVVASAIDRYLAHSGGGTIAAWGAWDEAKTYEYSRVAELFRAVQVADPLHPAGGTISGPYAPLDIRGDAESWSEFADRWLDEVQPEHMMFNNYPHAMSYPGAVEMSLEGLAHAANAAEQRGIPLHVWIQGAESRGYPLNAGRIRWGASTALAYGAKGLFWFIWKEGIVPNWSGIVDAADKPTQTAQWVGEVSCRIAALASKILGATRIGTWRLGPNVTYQQDEQSVTTSGPVLLGRFILANGREAAVIANLDVDQSASVTTKGVVVPGTYSIAPGDFITLLLD
jgi:hypothetical protein